MISNCPKRSTLKREKEDNTKAAASLTIPSPVSLDKFEQWDIPPHGGGKELNFSILYPETANIFGSYISH